METDKGFESYAAETFVSPTFNSLFSGLRAVNTARWFGGGGLSRLGLIDILAEQWARVFSVGPRRKGAPRTHLTALPHGSVPMSAVQSLETGSHARPVS